MSCAMSPSYYRCLLPDSIRLLRLLPHEDENAPIQCELFDYSLQESGKRIHLYDALSYVWGDSDNRRSIYIGKYHLPVTENLYAALSRLRNFSLERIIWVDAICINQKNTEEKEQQVRFMARIYGQANRVLVWLGEAADNSDEALEEIRAAGGKATNSLNNGMIHSAVLALLQRKWFRRIWILQEVAAARHVLIICGPTEIDGYAFCLGIDSLKEIFEARADLQSLIRSVTYLIRGAIFRPSYEINRTGGVPQAILGELIDMYHTHEATLPHDKVYALLGMSSDDLSKANLLPNYEIPWKELLQRLVKFLLCETISVETWSGKEIAVIKSKGCVLGRISLVRNVISLDGRQGVDVSFENISEQQAHWALRPMAKHIHWTLRPTAKHIRDGDFICLLQGASKPTIIRLCKDYFVVIMIAASPLETGRMESAHIKWPKLSARNFLLVWDWENSPTSQDLREYEALVRTNKWMSENSKKELGDDLDKATRTWNVAMILDDLKEFEKADERLREAIKGYEIAFKQERLYTPKSQCGRMPLSWAAGNGYDMVVDQLLTKDNIDPNLKDSQSGRAPLSWAAGNGHEAVVKLLLATGQVETDSNDNDGRTPLSWAAGNGHEAVVKLLLATGQVETDLKDNDGRTPLWWAARNGQETIVELLLATGQVKAGSKDYFGGRTPLSLAAERGHESIVKLLLASGQVKVDLQDHDVYGRTPLSLATSSGHEAVVKLLLATSQVEADSQDKYGRTPLSLATNSGHEAVVKLQFEADLMNKYGVPEHSSSYFQNRIPLVHSPAGFASLDLADQPGLPTVP